MKPSGEITRVVLMVLVIALLLAGSFGRCCRFSAA